MRRRWSTLVGAIAIGVATWAAIGHGPFQDAAGDAVAPDPVAAFAPLRELRTWYGALGGGAHLRIDAAGPYFTFDFRTVRYHYDGSALWMQEVRPLRDAGDPGPTPTPLPSEVAVRLRQAWDEARAGFPNTTFTEASPAALVPTWQPDPFHGDVWYRVNFPFAWASDVAVFVALRPVPQGWAVAFLSILDATSGEPLFELTAPGGSHHGRERFDSTQIPVSLEPAAYTKVDVPLGPDAYEPSYVVPAEVDYVVDLDRARDGMPYHEAVRRAALVYDFAASTGHTTGGTEVEALVVGPTTCTPDAVIRSEGTLEWVVPQDPATMARVTAGALQCPNRGFRMAPRVYVSVGSGARGCVVGDWTIVNRSTTPPTVVWQQSVDVCRSGPARVALPYDVEASLPPTAAVANLAVRFVGRAELRCPAIPDGSLHELAFDGRAPIPPFVQWDCWPGWDP